jgi:hypothetical protein
MRVQVADAHVQVQKLFSVVKVATVVEECCTEEQRSIVRLFYGRKDSMQRIFIRKCFLFTVGSDCCIKRFTTGSINSLKYVRKSQMIPDRVRMWLRQQSKQIYAVGFDSLVKQWDSVSMSVGDMFSNKCFLQVRI